MTVPQIIDLDGQRLKARDQCIRGLLILLGVMTAVVAGLLFALYSVLAVAICIFVVMFVWSVAIMAVNDIYEEDYIASAKAKGEMLCLM